MFQTRDALDMKNVKHLKEFISFHSGFIAGGCFKNLFTGEKIRDVDIFFKNQSDFVTAERAFKQSKDFVPLYRNKNTSAFKHKESSIVAELIRKIFGTPQEILEQFDFTIVKFAFYNKATVGESFDPWENDDEEFNFSESEYECLFHENFFEHLNLKRTLIDDKIPFPASTFERIVKYSKYGYTPCRETKIKVIQALSGLSDEERISETLSKSMYDGVD